MILVVLAIWVVAWCTTKTIQNPTLNPKVPSSVIVSGWVAVLTSTDARITVATWINISGTFFAMNLNKRKIGRSLVLPHTFSWFNVTITQSWSMITLTDTVTDQAETIHRLILPWGYTTEDYISSLVKTWSNCEVVEVEYEWSQFNSGSKTYQIVPIQADPSEQDSWIAEYKPAISPDECGEYTSHEWINRFIIVNPIQPSSVFIITAKPKTHIWFWQVERPLTVKIL